MLETLGGTSQPLQQRQGMNPLLQTARGRLQSKRSKLNDQINREVLLRNGAEKLLAAMADKKVKSQIALELSFFNSNIQLYKEELSDVNSTVDVYQFDSETISIPLLPLGLKETKEINFKTPFMDFILEHYSENGANYENEIQQLTDLRQAIRLPSRDLAGVRTYLEYFNQLYFVEKRFFSPDKKLPIFFHWYDSLKGIPDTQRSVAFERACVMYNVAALYTQIACKQDHTSSEGLNTALSNFQLSAGIFRYIRDNFNNAPSIDMQSFVLTALIHIMLSQAQECIFERTLLGGVPLNFAIHVAIAQEASTLSKLYSETHKFVSDMALSTIIPMSWVSMVKVKELYYRALSHYYLAMGLLDSTAESGDASVDIESVLETSYTDDCVYIPSDPNQHCANGKAHLREALILHAEALRDHDTCKHLRKIDTFKDILQLAHDRSLNKYEALEIEDDFTEMFQPRLIVPLAKQYAEPEMVDLAMYSVSDIFASLGPLSVFNALDNYTSPRLVSIVQSAAGFGFSVCGHAPVHVSEVDIGLPAHMAGLKVGDIVIAVQDHDTKWSTHGQVVTQIMSAGPCLHLKTVSPVPRINVPSYLPETPTKRSASAPCGKKSPSKTLSPNGSVMSHKSNKSNKSNKSGKWGGIKGMFSRRDSSKSEKAKSLNDDFVLRYVDDGRC